MGLLCLVFAMTWRNGSGSAVVDLAKDPSARSVDLAKDPSARSVDLAKDPSARSDLEMRRARSTLRFALGRSEERNSARFSGLLE